MRTFFDVTTFWLVNLSRTYPVSKSATMIVDVGANIGTFTLYALQESTAHVVALEPAPDSFSRVEQMIRCNGFTDRCTLIQGAIGATSSVTTIDLTAESQFRRTGTGGVEVPVLTLDEIIGRFGKTDLLKIDVEGAEYGAFRAASDATLGQISEITMEYHPTDNSGAEPGDLPGLVARLSNAGFQPIRQQDDGGGYGTMHFNRIDH